MSLIFDLPDIKCQYSLNNIGSSLYGSLSDLLQKPFEKCKVGTGTGTGEQYLPSTRNGKFRTTEIVFENREELNSLIMSKLECFMDDYQEYLQFDINNTYQVLKYEENDFFKRHQDYITDDYHYGTLLIFPPSVGELKHQGGKLVLDDDEFDSSCNTSWKAMFLYCQTFHEIEKVMSGKRIVLKTKLSLSGDYESDLEQDIYSDVCDVGISW
jgi:hypothetical protein